MKRLPANRPLSMILALLTALFVWHAGQSHAQVAEDGEEAAIFMKDILFTGNTVITTEALREAVKDFKERELTLADMNTVAEMVTMTYQEQGYILARAYLPEQEVTNGYLIVAVIEGKIEDMVVEGNTYYDPKLLKRFFKKQLEHGVVTENLLEKELLLANELASAETALLLKKGGKARLCQCRAQNHRQGPFQVRRGLQQLRHRGGEHQPLRGGGFHDRSVDRFDLFPAGGHGRRTGPLQHGQRRLPDSGQQLRHPI